MEMTHRLRDYASLMRLDKPVGIFLLLWPTLWALWLASNGRPDHHLLLIFVLGVVVMRSAGCILNDISDRGFDAHVSRTNMRPLATGRLSVPAACLLAGGLLACAFWLVQCCNGMTIVLAFIGVGLAVIYPLLKRVTHLPQFGLGLAFSWGIPMAFAAVTDNVPFGGWLLFVTGVIWPVIYDTMYAMADREDDIKIGIKSTAILFHSMDKAMIGLLQILFLLMLVMVGLLFRLHTIYFVSLIFVAVLFVYQQCLLYTHDKQHFLRAFKNNNWVGFVIFAGILMGC